MGTKRDPGKYDCYENALPDEPMFVLLARDPSAPVLVLEWALRRARDIILEERPKSDLALVDEAKKCAASMREWRASNEGAWRRKHASGPAICPDCKGERRLGGSLCPRCGGCAQIDRSRLRPGEKGAFER